MVINAIVRKGVGKSECEDTALINDKIVNDLACCCTDGLIRCICIADGVGGVSGGKDASMFIMNKINEHIFAELSVDVLKGYFEQLNQQLLDYGMKTGKQNMATTFTALFFDEQKVYLVHVGNTRLYAVRGSYLKQITTDHTTYQWFVGTGQYEAAENCNKSEIIGCMGGGTSKMSERLEVSEMSIGDLPAIMLMTSDGIHEYVDLDSMENIIADSEDDIGIVSEMIKIAEKNGSMDDKTAVIIRR